MWESFAKEVRVGDWESDSAKDKKAVENLQEGVTCEPDPGCDGEEERQENEQEADLRTARNRHCLAKARPGADGNDVTGRRRDLRRAETLSWVLSMSNLTGSQLLALD